MGQGAGSKEHGAKSKEQGARSMGQRARCSLLLAPCSSLTYPQSKGQSFPIPIPSNRPQILARHGSNRFIFPEDISIVSPNDIADFTKK
jgi:hypothetical protein